ncbi:MAG: phosphoglucosamine mutase [Candidatus Aminicenantes bacterium]|nr:phosphoglucosamine mutase [Candidatus Aminicenantes bacterium]
MTGCLFGTDGIRGLAGAFPLDETTLVKLGHNIGSLAANSKVIIGRDTRQSGATIEKQLARGLAKKARVYSCGVIPTPGLAFLTRKLGFKFGIMISASHNPFHDNGIKIFNHRGEKISNVLENKISARLKSVQKTDTGKTKITSINPSPEYMEFLQANGRGLMPGKTTIALDCANGAASLIAPELFRRLGLNIRTSHARPNGKNINAGCGSTYPQTLSKLVLAEKADLGVAFDGDADRAIFADTEGQILTGDHALYVMAHYLRHQEPRFNCRVVGTVMTNLGLETALAAQGMRLIRSGVGDSQVYRQMKKYGAILGGEPSGHIILKHMHSSGDGMLTALFFIKALEFFGWSSLDVRRQLPLYPQQIINIPVHHKKDLAGWKTLVYAQKEFTEKYGSEARLLIRYSGTEPLIRIMMEARDMGIIENKMPFFTSLIQNEIGA